MASPQPKRQRRGQDQIKIDVGGSVFVTSTSTLQFHSTYFASRFSSQWKSDDNSDEKEEETFFLDQDPQAFSILLSYMRTGCIDQADLTKAVLAMSEFLGLTELIKAVKYTAFCYLHPEQLVDETGKIIVEEEEICRMFDEKHGGLLDALRSGLLPASVQPPETTRGPREVAQLTIYMTKITTGNPIWGDSLFTKVCVGESQSMVPGCHSFLDGLNWLHRHGFVRKEKRPPSVNVIIDRHIKSRFWFSRSLNDENISKITSNCIVFSNTYASQRSLQRKQFALTMEFGDDQNFLLYEDKGADHNRLMTWECDEGDEFVPTLLERPPGAPSTFTSRLTWKEARTNEEMIHIKDFLAKRGYTDNKEPWLEEEYRGSFHAAMGLLVGDAPNSEERTKFYSRPLPESEYDTYYPNDSSAPTVL